MQIKKYQSVLSQDEIELIHEKSLYLLENNGEIIESREMLEVCEKNGFRVEGDRVYFPREKVEEALKTVPKNFKLRGRNGAETWDIRDGRTKLSPALGPMNIFQHGEYRPTTMKDFLDLTVLHETSDFVAFSATNTMRPRDMDLSPMENAMMRLAMTLAYSTKPMMLFCEGGEIAEKTFEVIEEFYGSDNLNDVYCMTNISTASPFRLPHDTCETFLSFCNKNQILCVQGSGMPGLTTPPTLAGTLLQGNAEKLALVTLSQLINPGNPVMYSPISMLSDLRYTSCITSSAAAPYRVMAEKDLAEYYGLPTFGPAGLVDAKELDYQCGAEAFMMTYFAYHAELDVVAQSLGVMDSYNTISFEKFIMDEENARIITKLLQPIAVDEKRMKIDKILKAGPSGNYLGRTEKMYKEDFYMSDLYVTKSSSEWLKEDNRSLEEKASSMYQKRLEEYCPTEFTSAQKEIINRYVPSDLQIEKK